MMSVEATEIAKTWNQNNALNLAWLSHVTDEDLELKPGSGKTIRSNFVHLISVRRMWCESKLPTVAATIPKLDWKTATTDEIQSGLMISNQAMIQLFEARLNAKRPNKTSLLTFFAVCIAHEAHHRCQIELSMRLAKQEPNEKFLYGLWEWDSPIEPNH